MLDDGVLASALLFPGEDSEHVLRRCLEERDELITSTRLLHATSRLLRDVGWERALIAHGLRLFATAAAWVSPARPGGERIRAFEAAVDGEADAVVTIDRRLLRLGEWRGIGLGTPAEFVAEHGR